MTKTREFTGDARRIGPRAWLRTAVAAAVVAAAAIAVAADDGPVQPPKPARNIPVVATLQMRAAKDPLLALRGRVVLLHFFGTFYERCAEAVPDLNALHDRLGPRGLTLLGITSEEERPIVEAWVAKTGAKWPVAITDGPTKENLLQRDYPAPGFPWSYLIDSAGNIVWRGHPQNLKDEQIAPFLDATTQPPVLPAALADAQKDLDAGVWAKARVTLQSAIDGGKLAKPDAAWAKGVAKWIELRRTRTIAEGEAFEKQGWWWDAWWTYDDYTRRFEGLEGCDVARQKADAVRANADPAVKQDLAWGDDFAKAKDYVAKGKSDPARLICQRIAKLKSRFADRAKELLATLSAK